MSVQKTDGPTLLDSLRPEARDAPDSGILEVFDYGRDRQGLIPLWAGESDVATPSFIGDAITRSLAAGETFYTHQRGIPELRAAIAAYMTRTYGGPFVGNEAPFEPERFFVTIGGMHAIQLAVRLVAGAGDEVIVPTPAWPNFMGALTVAGARAIEVPLRFESRPSPAWTLDVDTVRQAITPRTRALVVNSPGNPTGWVASLEDCAALLALAREHGLWIIADEIYGKFVYDRPLAPSFHDVMEPDDRILFAQTFSKNWTMTGLRVGWLEAPAAFGPIIENLVQYSSSGVAVPLQRGAETAISYGDRYLAEQVVRVRQSRDILAAALERTGRVEFAMPTGAFYLFCRIDGQPDTRALCLRLVDETGLGMAPGTAFGAGGADFVRICFARKPADMTEVARRLSAWLGGSSTRNEDAVRRSPS